MGNVPAKISVCFTGDDGGRRRKDMAVVISDPLDDLGHSFVYVRPDPSRLSLSKVHSEEATTFRSISGAAVSANTATPLSTALDHHSYTTASAFESSTSFASIPLQPLPRNSVHSGPLPSMNGVSGPIERGFVSGPIERGFFSGPLDPEKNSFKRSLSYSSSYTTTLRPGSRSLIRVVKKAISKTISRRGHSSIVAPVKGVVVSQNDWINNGHEMSNELTINSSLNSEVSLDDEESFQSQNLQWAHGKAGEDRVQVVVSEEHGWVFVGIYDGFNGPDATDFLLSNLYVSVYKELKGLLWDDHASTNTSSSVFPFDTNQKNDVDDICVVVDEEDRSKYGRIRGIVQESYPSRAIDLNFELHSRRKRGKNSRIGYKGVGKKWEENQRRWRCEWDRERLELDRRLKEENNQIGSGGINHSDVLKALSQALRKTEEAYLGIADMMLVENPELALMGSCVLVMLMKGEDVYVMNVGDSRAVLAQKAEPDVWRQDLERINEETMYDLVACDADVATTMPNLTACQLSTDHSTSVEEEVQRIKNEHRDDACALMNDRVKGSLKVTRAFGAGFLKQPKWNNALLEMFRIDYVGSSPYINCLPSLYHHRLGPRDRFLILSSDGLYQYFTNEEAVSEVELFIAWSPEGDPAQHLVEEVLFRAAKKAGLDFHELLEIPQGDRRRYHDDVSIIVISLEGRIWRSCV